MLVYKNKTLIVSETVFLYINKILYAVLSYNNKKKKVETGNCGRFFYTYMWYSHHMNTDKKNNNKKYSFEKTHGYGID